MRSVWGGKVVGSNPTTETKLGSVAERSKALVLKTRVRQRTVGSNPTASAICERGGMVTQQIANLYNAGSNPVAHSIFFVNTLL